MSVSYALSSKVPMEYDKVSAIFERHGLDMIWIRLDTRNGRFFNFLLWKNREGSTDTNADIRAKDTDTL